MENYVVNKLVQADLYNMIIPRAIMVKEKWDNTDHCGSTA